MFTLGLRLKRFTLLFGDAVIFQLALILTLALRYGGFNHASWKSHVEPFGFITLLWLLGLYVAGLYDLGLMKNGIKFFRHYLEGMIANLAVAFTFFYLVPLFGIEPRTNLFLYFAISLLLGYSWRLFYNRFIANAFFRNRVLYVGSGADALKIHKLLEQPIYGFSLVSVLETNDGTRFEAENVTWHRNIDDLHDIVQREKIDTILLGHQLHEVPRLREALYKTIYSQVAVLDRATFEEGMTGRVPLEFVSQTWFLDNLRERQKTWYESVKRWSDIMIAIPIALFTILVYPIIAVLIKISSSGSILYSQIRIGKYGKKFRIWKFRTMKKDAEEIGKPQFTTEDDPRITSVGKFLRVTRLDELPQIWNVLRGDMSLIGPRPERPEFVEALIEQMPYYALRHLVRPGLTGWAQVRFPYAGTIEDNLKKLQYDLYYIKNRSVVLDAAVLLKTIGIVLRRQGT
ncbi:MAG: sugar transferase [bacterium]|nr:sugar transferase [bacterium]